MGPGNVPELTGDHIGVCIAEKTGEERQVVVLNENRSRPAVDLFYNMLGESPVYGGVGIPVSLIEGRLDKGIVAKRPQTLVGHSVVVALLLFVA